MKTTKRLVLDLALFGGFLAALSPRITGLPVHEWLSLAITVPALIHLVINWDWTVRIAKTFWTKLMSMSRLNFVIDVALFASAVTVMLSGLAVSQVIAGTIGLASTAGVVWHVLHSSSAMLTLFLLMAHFALHAEWFARAIGLVARDPERSARAASYATVHPVPVSAGHPAQTPHA